MGDHAGHAPAHGQPALVDDIVIHEVGVGLPQMMELAGRNLSHVGRRRFLSGCIMEKSERPARWIS